MIDVTVPVIHKTGINSPIVVIIVKAVSFMMIPSFLPCAAVRCDGSSMIPVTTSRLPSHFAPLCLLLIH
jgi:hypothetical protein